MADHLPTELLGIIGLKLECTGYRIRFRAVSKSWRSAIPFRQPPLLILSQPRGLVSVGDQTISKVDLPQIHGARVVGSAEYSNVGCRNPVPGDPKYYLVEWLGELLKIVRYIMTDDHDHDSYRTHTFKIYRVVDFANPDLVELDSLGDHSLFLGYNTSVSLLASDYFGLVRRNCIYFTDDRRVVDRNSKFIGDERGHDMGVFDLESNTILPHFEGVSTSRYSPPVWIIPQYSM